MTKFNWIIIFMSIGICFILARIEQTMRAGLEELKTITLLLDNKMRQDFNDKYR